MVALLLFLLFGVCIAQEFQASCSGLAGGEIYAREGFSCPIAVTLEQTRGERHVLISLSDLEDDNLLIQKKISLIGASKKRLFLYFTPFSLPTRFQIQIQPDDLPAIEKELLIKEIPPEKPFYLCYSQRAHLFQFFNQILVPPVTTEEMSSADWVPLHCQSTQLWPSQAEGYEHAQGIILEDTQEHLLSGVQRDAIKEWTIRGGHLIYCLTDIPSGEENRFLEEWLGWKIGPIQKLEDIPKDPLFEHLETGPFFFRQVSGHRLSDIQLSIQEKPLLLSRSLGAGQVTLLTLDIGRPPFKTWKNRDSLVQHLVLILPAFFCPADKNYQQFLENSLSKIANAGQIYFLFLYLGILLLLTSLGAYWGVKRWSGRWYLVLPSIILILIGMAYLTQLRWRRAPETEIQIDFSYYWENLGVKRSYFSLFSFERRLLSFSWNIEKKGFPSYWRRSSQEKSPPKNTILGTLLQEETPQFQKMLINPWNWAYFQSTQTVQALKDPLSYSIRWEQEQLTGHLINHTPHRFERLLIIRESPLNQYSSGNRKYPPWIATLGALEPYSVLAFRKRPTSVSVSTDWDRTLAEIGATPYSWETHHFFETLPLRRGKTLIVGISIQETSSTKQHYSYFFIEGSE